MKKLKNVKEVKTIKDVLFALDINIKQFKIMSFYYDCQPTDKASLAIDMVEQEYLIYDDKDNIIEIFCFQEVESIKKDEETYINKSGITYDDLMEYMKLDDYILNHLAISEIFNLSYDYSQYDLASPETIKRTYDLVEKKNKEKQALQDKLKEFKKVANELELLMHETDDCEIHNAIASDYPFDKSFDDVSLDIQEWVQSASAEIEKLK